MRGNSRPPWPRWGPLTIMFLVLGLCGGSVAMVADENDPQEVPDPDETSRPRAKLIILGTGTPVADPVRWGPAVAVVVGDDAYLVDAGVGIVRRAAAASKKGVDALTPHRLRRVFITHLHSDHTLGLPDLMLSPWVLDRSDPLEVYGPPGTESMTQHIEAAWRDDIDMRLFGLEPRSSRTYRALVREIGPGLVYEDEAVRVEAVPVSHGSWPEAFAFVFRTADRTFVVSGDTRPSETLVAASRDCDVLVHEVYSAVRFESRPPEWQEYHRAYHTSTVELARMAREARPRLLVLYHQLYWGATDADLEREIREAGYDGQVVSAQDLDEF